MVEGFIPDFGGDSSDYIEVAPDEAVDFAKITPTQVGNGLRQWMETVPAPDLPPDLDLDEVDWTSIGEQLSQIAGTAMGGM
ncbi:MAG: hypothetical protein ACHQE5_01450 [Actinomycetes bacterium]